MGDRPPRKPNCLVDNGLFLFKCVRIVSLTAASIILQLILFLRRNLKGCPEKLKQTAYFSLIRSFMEYGATVWDPYQKYNSDKVERVQRRAARFVKSRYSRHYSVSDMLDVLGWMPLSQRRQEARLILFYKIINGLAQVPFDGVLVEAYRRKHSMKFRQIGQSFFPKTISAWNGLAFAEALALAVFRSNFI